MASARANRRRIEHRVLSLDMSITLGVLAAAIGSYVLASRHDARPADPLKPRLVPWKLVIIALGFVAFVALIHLVNLLGIDTSKGGPAR